MDYTTISSGVVLTSSRTRSGLVPPFSRFTLEKAGKTGRSVGEILDQSAMRSGAVWENGNANHYFGMIAVASISISTSSRNNLFTCTSVLAGGFLVLMNR